MSRPPRNLAASIHRRLLNGARERGEDVQFILQRYAAERFLYRLGQANHREMFVLKGAMLFALWGGRGRSAGRLKTCAARMDPRNLLRRRGRRLGSRSISATGARSASFSATFRASSPKNVELARGDRFRPSGSLQPVDPCNRSAAGVAAQRRCRSRSEPHLTALVAPCGPSQGGGSAGTGEAGPSVTASDTLGRPVRE